MFRLQGRLTNSMRSGRWDFRNHMTAKQPHVFHRNFLVKPSFFLVKLFGPFVMDTVSNSQKSYGIFRLDNYPNSLIYGKLNIQPKKLYCLRVRHSVTLFFFRSKDWFWRHSTQFKHKLGENFVSLFGILSFFFYSLFVIFKYMRWWVKVLSTKCKYAGKKVKKINLLTASLCKSFNGDKGTNDKYFDEVVSFRKYRKLIVEE